MNKRVGIGIGAVVALAVAAFLAFGVFGIQTAFIDDEVSEANPFADAVTSGAVTSDAATSDAVSSDAAEPAEAEEAPADPPPAEAAPAEQDQAEEAPAEEAAAVEEPPAEPTAAPEPAEPAEPEIVTLASGSLIDHDHSGEGTINVISNGDRTFLRFEDDFAIDNGPDLNVYLVRGVDAVGPAGEFDDDFIDLGDLKGNIGAQNYELDPSIDVSEYDTLVIWCVRFGVAFNAADLAA